METESKVVNSKGKLYLLEGLEGREDHHIVARVEELPDDVGLGSNS